MADAVATLTGLLYSGEMEDSQGAHGYQVKGNFQQLLSKQTELITAYNAMIAEYLDIINTNDAAAVLADVGMLARLDALEAEIAGTFADGVTIRNIRVALEAGLIETSDNTSLILNGLEITEGGHVGVQTVPANWNTGAGTRIGGAVFSFGHQVHNVYAPTTSGAWTLSSAYWLYKTIVITAATATTSVVLPNATLVPEGAEWTFVNHKTGPSDNYILIGDYHLLVGHYVTIRRAMGDFLVVGEGTSATVV